MPQPAPARISGGDHGGKPAACPTVPCTRAFFMQRRGGSIYWRSGAHTSFLCPSPPPVPSSFGGAVALPWTMPTGGRCPCALPTPMRLPIRACWPWHDPTTLHRCFVIVVFAATAPQSLAVSGGSTLTAQGANTFPRARTEDEGGETEGFPRAGYIAPVFIVCIKFLGTSGCYFEFVSASGAVLRRRQSPMLRVSPRVTLLRAADAPPIPQTESGAVDKSDDFYPYLLWQL